MVAAYVDLGVGELTACAAHVHHTVRAGPPHLVWTASAETWTTTKLLRRLAWHEPSELVTMRALAAT